MEAVYIQYQKKMYSFLVALFIEFILFWVFIIPVQINWSNRSVINQDPYNNSQNSNLIHMQLSARENPK